MGNIKHEQSKFNEEIIKNIDMGDQYKEIFNTVNDMIFITEHDNDMNFKRIIDVNDSVVKTLKYSKKEILALKEYHLLDNIHLEEETENIFELLRERKGRFNFILRDKNGKRIYIKVKCHPIKIGNRFHLISVCKDITKEKDTENELGQAYEKINKIFNTIGDGICILDTDLNILDCNYKLLELLEKDKKRVIGKHCCKLTVDNNCNKENCSLMEVIKNKKSINYEITINVDNGINKVCVVSASPLTNEYGKVIGIVKSFKDITEIKQSQDKLRRATNLMEGILQGIPDIVALLKWDYTILASNKAGCKAMGKPLEEMVGRKCFEVKGRNRPCEYCKFNDVLKNKKMVSYTRYHKAQDLYRDCSLNPILDEEGEVQYIVERIKDITEEKKFEQKLIEIQSRLKAILDHLPYCAWMKDRDGKYITVNRVFRNTYSILKDDDVIGRRAKEVLGDIFSEEYYNADIKIIKNKKAKTEVNKITTKDGIKWIKIYRSPIFDEDNNVIGLAGTMKDITKQRLQENRLRIAKKEAEKANKLKTNFLANMSHEIRTPINGIIGTINLISETSLNRKQREYIDMLKVSSNHLFSLLNDILDISKIESGKMELEPVDFNFHSFIKEIHSHFKIQAHQKGLNFVASMDMDIPDILFGDNHRLRQILFNLIGNAIKFTNKGTIELKVTLEDKADKKVGLKFTVSDTGIGISQEDKGLLFKKFAQGEHSNKNKYGGTGLGLALCKELVNMMGGYIDVKSEKGKGSQFYFVVDLVTSESYTYLSDSDLYYNSQREFHNEKLNILVAEDDEISQNIIKTLLKNKGWNIEVVATGREVIKKVDKYSYDIIIMDINMPEMDGYTATEKIRGIEKDSKDYTPILALTAAAMKEDKEKSLNVGMDDYLSKPIRPNELYKKVNQLVNKKNKTDINLNMDKILMNLDGNKELLKILVDDFTSDKYQKNIVEKLEEAIELGTRENIIKYAHKFKGTVSYFEIPHLYDIAYKIEKKAKNNNYSNMKCLYNKLKRDYNKLKDKLKIYNIN